MNSVRVRFAPSPTGPLHIGGLRTALYNYLFAKSQGGTFLLRVEDTDQNRFVEGAEDYISQTLHWVGIPPEEGPGIGGVYGPYRQSERQHIYNKHILTLIQNGSAYYAFDTAEDIDAMRSRMEMAGRHSPKYDHSTRGDMRNSLTMSQQEVDDLLAQNHEYTIRLKVEPERQIEFTDEIRGSVTFNSSELDDKVLMKSDGLPTYHLANVIDDYSMKISHVIRGEEWLSSTAHHVLLYQAFGWNDVMPKFAHLPLILKPTGKGKLSKRDGQKLGIPVFPMNWMSDEGLYLGFKDMGFLPEALINFLAFVGWNPGTEQEIFNLDELASAFSLEHVSKSGARFDYDKAKWYNQQYLLAADTEVLAQSLSEQLTSKGMEKDSQFLKDYIELFRPRIETLNDLYPVGYYFFENIRDYDEKMIRKKWKGNGLQTFYGVCVKLSEVDNWKSEALKKVVEQGIETHNSSFGELLPLLRIALTGDTKGADLFKTMELMTRQSTMDRLEKAGELFDQIAVQS
jgi:glutamyl-tRNA synthetase